VVAIFAYAIPKFANYGSVWAILRMLTWPQFGLLAADGPTQAGALVHPRR
jgi:hypothetical protein